MISLQINKNSDSDLFLQQRTKSSTPNLQPSQPPTPIFNPILQPNSNNLTIMEQSKTTPIVSFEPSEILPFKLTPSSSTSSSYLQIKNLSDSFIIYKIKLSNPDLFQIENSPGSIPPGSCKKLKLTYMSSPSPPSSMQKFLALISQTSSPNVDPEDLFWETNCQTFKFWPSFVESDSKSPFESETELALSKNRLLKDKIEKNKQKLEESKNLNYLTKEKMGAFGITELVVLFISGVILGLLINIFIKSR